MKQKKVTVVAFGDSITQASEQELANRWPERLRVMLEERFPEIEIALVNAGVGGNTTREGLRRIEKDVLAHRPDFVTVEFGNDSTHEPERHVEIEEYMVNFGKIQAQVEKASGAKMIVLVFPPIESSWHQFAKMENVIQQGGVDKCQEPYREATRKLAKERGLPLVDIDAVLRAEMKKKGPGECLLPDGVHLTARGNELVALAVYETLEKVIK